MQQLLEFQLRHRSKFSQLILLNKQAVIVSSCDSIFDTIPLKDKPVIDWFPFLESIFTNIWETASNQSNISFNKMETPIPQLPGTYDFSFSKIIIDKEELLLWCVYDYTDLYEDFKQFQQRKNELEIHRETLERRHQLFKNIEDINIQQNIIIESLDHLQLTYFNKIKSALLAPINALDGITYLLSGALENKDSKYTQQLRVTLKQLNLILDELETTNISNMPNFANQDFFLTDLCNETKDLIRKKNTQTKLTFTIDENIPKSLKGNYLYLKQTLWGIVGNAVSLHPESTFEIKINQSSKKENTLIINFQVVELLNKKTTFLSEQDYSTMIYRLSIVKQLLDLQKSSVDVSKNPKELSITVGFDLEYMV